MAEERKLVTVLFADVVGSTALAGDHDPEVVRAVMGRYFDRLAEIAENHGGTVEKFAGDAVMVVFGVPTVHDDDAERAVRAALASRDAVGEMNGRLPISLRVRVGVNSGEAVTAARADRQFLVSGDVVNIAARLQQGAEPGEVVVGALTESLTRETIEYEVRAPIIARGKPEPVLAFLALQPRTVVPTQARGLPGLRAPLVGRVRELRLLVETYGRVVEDGRPHLFTLVGGGGVGKSRLVAEALIHPSLAGARVLRGRCLPYGQGITYWPLIEMLDRTLPEVGGPESERLAVSARLAVLLGLQVPAVAMPDVPPERVGKEIAWAVRRHFQALASGSPLIVVIDDLQWAEDPLIELVEHLTDRMGEVPLLLLSVARPEFLERQRNWSSGKPNATTLTLDPLTPQEIGVLISRLLDLDALPAGLRERIVERSEGTPLYCEEFLRMLIEEGRIVRDGDSWRSVGGNAEISVPHTIQALLAARLDGLSEGEKALLQAASVIGERFGLDEATGLLGHPAHEELDSVMGKGLLVEGERPDEARFRHLLIRDAAYGSMPKSRRADLHDSYAAALSASPDAEQLAEIIAHHADRAVTLSAELLLGAETVEPRARRAVHWTLLLAGRAYDRRELPALETALRLARATVGYLPAVSGAPARARIAVKEAQLLYSRGEFAAARTMVGQAVTAAEAAGLRDVVADARLLDLWIYSQAGEGSLENLQPLLDRLVPVCRELGDEGRELEGRSVAAFRHWATGRLTEYVEELTAVADRLRALGQEPQVAAILIRVATAEMFRGHLQRAEVILSAAIEIAKRLGLQDLLARVELNKGNIALLGGDAVAAESHFRRLIAHAEETGASVMLGLRFLAYALDEQGRHAEAAAGLDRAIAHAEATGDRWSRSELYAIRARLALALGDRELANRMIDNSLAWLRQDDATGEVEDMQAMARIRAAEGRFDEAEVAFQRGQRAISATEFNWPRTIISLEYAEFLTDQGRLNEAAVLLDEREPFLRQAGWHLWDARIAALRQRITAG